MRCQQVTLDPVQHEVECMLVSALALCCQSLSDPGRQLLTLDIRDLDIHCVPLQGAHPGTLLRRPVKFGQGDHGQSVACLSTLTASCVILQRLTAVFARFAGRDAQFDQLAITKQGHRLLYRLQLTPFEVAFGDEYLALGKTGRACLGADPIRCFEQ